MLIDVKVEKISISNRELKVETSIKMRRRAPISSSISNRELKEKNLFFYGGPRRLSRGHLK